jgi:Lipid A core - O-antigen ligase and related enzymes
MKPSLSSSILQSARQVLYWGPLVALPLMLNFRWSHFMTPNEDSKWAVLVLLGAVLAAAYALMRHQECRQSSADKVGDPAPGNRGMTWAGWGLLLFLLGLGWGVTYAPSPALAFVRSTFWLATAMTLCAVIWAARRSPHYGRDLQVAVTLSAVILSVWFIYGWVTDIGLGQGNWPVRFSRIGHQNFTGDVLVMLVPLLVWIAWRPEVVTYRRLMQGGAVFALLVCIFMMMAGGMVGAMAGLGLGFVIALLPVLRSHLFRMQARRWLGSRPRWLGWVLLLVAVSIGWVGRDTWVEWGSRAFAFSAWEMSANDETNLTGPQPPFSNLWARLTPVFGRRVPMWAATGGMIADAPWTGFGTDAFIPIYPAYSDRYPLFRDPENFVNLIKTNPHNAYLQIAAENGLPLLGLFCGLLLWLGIRLFRALGRQPAVGSFVAVWAYGAMVFDAGFNHVFYNPASLYMIALTFGYALSWGGGSNRPCPTGWTCRLWQPRWTVVSAGLVITLILSVPVRWLIAEYQVYGNQLWIALDKPTPQQVTAAWRPVLEGFSDHPAARLGLAKAQLEAGLYPAAAASFESFLQVMPYNVQGLSLLAMAQARQGQLEAAIANIQRAQALEPDEKGFQDSLRQLEAEQARRRGH